MGWSLRLKGMLPTACCVAEAGTCKYLTLAQFDPLVEGIEIQLALCDKLLLDIGTLVNLPLEKFWALNLSLEHFERLHEFQA
jgi:hypothetical protein